MERTITGATHSTAKTNVTAFVHTMVQHEEAAILPKTSLLYGIMIYANFPAVHLVATGYTAINGIQ
jgi:hypothetical protein